jgi:hypothetical protein
MVRIATATRTICIVTALLGGAHAGGCRSEETEARDDLEVGERQPQTLAAAPVAPPAAFPIEALPAVKHPGHLANKDLRASKPPAPKAVAGAGGARPVAADVIRKQADYLRRWSELQPRIAHLSPDEQEARRDALKHAVLGN